MVSDALLSDQRTILLHIQDPGTSGRDMTIFHMICNGVVVNLHQSKFKQPDPLVTLLSLTDDYVLSCTDLLLPNLEIDDKFKLAQPSSPIMDDIVVLPTETTMNVVRRNT